MLKKYSKKGKFMTSGKCDCIACEQKEDRTKQHLKARLDHYAGLAMMGFIIGEARNPKGIKMADVAQASFEMSKAMVRHEVEHQKEIDNFIAEL